MAFVTGNQVKQQSERRVWERRRVSLGSWVTSLDGSILIPCQTSDASAHGVRIHAKADQTLPRNVYYIDTNDRMVYEAEVRWQDKNAAGLQLTKAYRFMDMPVPAIKKVISELSQ